MAITATLAFAARRNEIRTWTMRFVGVDWTAEAFRAQVRLYRDQPGDPLIDLAQVDSSASQGLKVVGLTTEDGVPVTTVTGRINKSTMDALPYAGESGSDAQFVWAVQVGGVTRIVGDFWALAGVLDTDGATPGGISMSPARAPGAWSATSLSIADEEVVRVVIDGADVLSAIASQAQASADAAALSEATAESVVGPNYANTAGGLAATTNGQSFAVDNGDGTVTIYRNVSGSAVEQRTLATTDALAADTGAERVGHKSAGTGAASRTAAQVMDEFVFASGFTGYDADGEAHTTSDSYAAIMAADAVARARNKELVLYGRPRIKSPIVIDAPTRWRMQGQHYKPGFLNGGSAIIKDASINGSAIRISKNAYATTLEGIGLLGIGGNGGDGIHLEGNRCRLIDCSIQGMGQDGIRIGAKAPDIGINADCFRVVRCSSGYNARHGVNIDDLSGVTNANAGLADGLDCPNNGSHGLYINNAYLGNVFLAPLCEANAGHGIYLDTNAQHNVFTGGDIEANVAGQVYEAVPGANQFVGTLVQGVVWNSTTRSGSFTPTIYGSSSAGAGTYTIQKGRLSLSGNRVDVDILITWTAHTGTGSMRFTLPTGFLPNSALAAIPDFVSCVVLPNSGGLTVPAGGILTGAIIPTGQYGAVYYFTVGATGLSALTMCSAGSLIIRASYELNPPVERL